VRLAAVRREWRKTAVFLGLMTFLSRHFMAQGCDLALISGTVRELKLYRHLGFEPFRESPSAGDGALGSATHGSLSCARPELRKLDPGQ